MGSMITDIQFITGAGGRHIAVVVDGVPCAYLSVKGPQKSPYLVELHVGRSAPAYLSAGRKVFLSLDGAKSSILAAARAVPHQMVIAL